MPESKDTSRVPSARKAVYESPAGIPPTPTVSRKVLKLKLIVVSIVACSVGVSILLAAGWFLSKRGDRLAIGSSAPSIASHGKDNDREDGLLPATGDAGIGQYKGPPLFEDIGRIQVRTQPYAVLFRDDNVLISGHMDVSSVQVRKNLDVPVSNPDTGEIVLFPTPFEMSVGDPVLLRNNGELQTWDIRTRTLLRTDKMAGGVKAMTLDRSKRRIAVVGLFAHVAVADVSRPDKWETWGFGSGGFATDVAFSHDDKWLYAPTTDGRLLIFNAANGRLHDSLRIHGRSNFSNNNQISLSPDSSQLLYWSDTSEGTYIVNLMPTATCEPIEGAQGPGLFLDNNKSLLLCFNGIYTPSRTTAQLFRITLGDESSKRAITTFNAALNRMHFHTDPTIALLADSTGMVHALNLSTGGFQASRPVHVHACSGWSQSPDGRTIASLGSSPHFIQLTSTDGRRVKAHPNLLPEDFTTLAVAISEDWRGDFTQTPTTEENLAESWSRLVRNSHPDVSFCLDAALVLDLFRIRWNRITNRHSDERTKISLNRLKLAADATREFLRSRSDGPHPNTPEAYFKIANIELIVALEDYELQIHRGVRSRFMRLVDKFSGKDEFPNVPIEISISFNDRPTGLARTNDRDTRIAEEGSRLLRIKNISGRALSRCAISVTMENPGFYTPVGPDHVSGLCFVPDWPEGKVVTILTKGFNRAAMAFPPAKVNVYEARQRYTGKVIPISDSTN